MIPINPSTVDYITYVTSAIDKLVTSGAPVFLSVGVQLLTALAVIRLVLVGLKLATESASRHHGEFPFPELIHFFTLFVVAEAVLRYYNSPLPWVGVSTSQILPDTARYFAGMIDLSTLNTLLAKIGAAVTSGERPSILNPLELIVYALILSNLILFEGLLFGINILSFIFLGVGALFGPLMVPWLLIPRLSFLFWNWLQFMVQYSFYRVVAAGLTYIWANVMITFFDSAVHGDYSLAHFLILLLPLGMLDVGFIFTVVRTHSIVSDLFKGTAGAGANWTGTMLLAASRAFV